jgi:glutamyl/glutaminyl-tRNA synthetase
MPFDGRDGGHVRARVPRRRQAFDSTAKRRYLALLGIGQSMCICGCSLSSAPAFAAHDDGVSSDSASRESPAVPARIRRHSRLHIPAVFSQENHADRLDAINPDIRRGRQPRPRKAELARRRALFPATIPFSRELYIEQDDFMEVPPPKFFRLKPGGEVRLKYAYIIKCDEVIKDATGKVVELRCSADLTSKTGGATAGRKIKGTIHWVSAKECIDAECRLYDRLFTAAEPDADGDFKKNINPHSLDIVTGKLEPSLREASPELRYQFERLGYFCLDVGSQPSAVSGQPKAESRPLIFNRTITLKDTWAKEVKKG